jgi:hypothetical protein
MRARASFGKCCVTPFTVTPCLVPVKLIGRADERAFNEYVRALLDSRSDTLCQKWPEHNDPMPLGFRALFVIWVFQERCVATDSTVNFEPLPFA